MAKYKPVAAAKVRACIKTWNDANKSNHVQYYHFLDFILGDQWNDDEARVFENYKKIPLTVNKISPMANNLMGHQRQNTSQLQVEPHDSIDAETAEVREALIKKISLEGQAKTVYQIGYKQAVIGGFGACGWGTEYENESSFDQTIKPFAFNDPCKCYWDIGAKEVCKTDGKFAGYRSRITRRTLIAKWGKALNDKIGDTSFDVEDDSNVTNMSLSDADSVTLVYHYERKSKRVKLVQLSTGDILQGDELEALEPMYEGIEQKDLGVFYYKGEPVRIENSRDAEQYYIEVSIWAGDYELDREPFPSKQLPIIFIDQDSYYDKHGKQIFRPFFKDAKDTQTYLNYLRTQKAHLVKIMRNDQYLASKKNVASPDTQKIWSDPSVVQGALLYDESPNGNKPEKQLPGEISRSLTDEYNEASMDLAFTTGIFDTQMGNQGDVVSGKASEAQTYQGGVNTYITRDALDRAIECSGRIVNEMIPKVYDTERSLSLNIPNKGRRKVTINQMQDVYGSKIKNDMTQGEYRVSLIAGKSYEGEKTQNRDSIEMILQNAPQLFNLIGDILVKNLPMTDTIELENRIRTIIPPEIIEAGKTGQVPPPKPQPPDPAIVLKQQELQVKMISANMDYQHKMAVLAQQQQKMMLDAHLSGSDMTVKMQQIQADKDALHVAIEDNKRRYDAEMERLKFDANAHHSEQMFKVLTHEPKHLEVKNESRPIAGR